MGGHHITNRIQSFKCNISLSKGSKTIFRVLRDAYYPLVFHNKVLNVLPRYELTSDHSLYRGIITM